MAAAGGTPATMRAVQYSGYGAGAGALKHVKIPVPSVKKHEFLIKVEAASINPVDWIIQKGMLRPFLPKFPFIPASDVAGEIVQVGSGVHELKVGDKVLCRLNFWKGGGLAEYVAAPESLTAVRPAGVSAADAAGLPIAGLTALRALLSIGTKFDGTGTGANVLVTAASGGVGTYAVQLAKLGGHHVTATCGARNMDLVRSLGADVVIDYKTPEGAALSTSSPTGEKYDYIINTAVTVDWSAMKPALRSHGRAVDITPNPRNYVAAALTMFARKKIAMMALVSLGKAELRFLMELVGEGRLATVVDSWHPLEKAAEAWEKSMGGHATGKIIVEM